MAYVISECGFETPKRFDSLASALRIVARMVAKNEREGESNYIAVYDADLPRDGKRHAAVAIHEEGAASKAHTASLLADSAARADAFKREDCYQCDGDGFSGDPLGGNCPRCGGGGKELSR